MVNLNNIWLNSILVSVILICLITLKFYSEHSSYHHSDNQLISQSDLESHTQNITNPNLIPTGIFVQSVNFKSANIIHVSGYIWQKYTSGKHDKLTKGFILPEALDAKFKQIYKEKIDNTELIKWYFETDLIEKFDYTKYPLDNKTVWIRIWPQDFGKNIVLVPDFDSYPKTGVEDEFGIDKEMVLSGYTIKDTFFNYKKHLYSTNFGLNNKINQGIPELYFNIEIKRDFTNAFFKHLLPAIMAFLISFALCMLMSIHKNNNMTTKLSVCTALTFVIVLMNMNLRSSTIGGNIVFIEYIYLLVTSFVTFLCFNAVAVAYPGGKLAKIFRVKYHNNLIIKATYCPTFLLLVFIICILAL